MSLRFGELCAGVSGFGQGFERSGMLLKWWCEIDPHCRKLLADKYRESDSGDDIVTFETRADRRVDVLAGGTPCQGFSVAGLRGSLADDRSNLCLRFCTIADELDPTVIVWENVPGVLSASDNAFGCFLARLAGADTPLVPTGECGGRWTNAGMVDGPRRAVAWRILDAQYTGVAQRRARVFVVASSRRELPFQILFEPEGVRRHSPPSRGAREGVAGTISSRTEGGGGLGTDFELGGRCSRSLTTGSGGGRYDKQPHTIVGALSNGAHDGGGRTDRTPTPDELSLPDIAWALQERDAKGPDSSTKDGHLIPTRRGGSFDDAKPMWAHGRFFCRRCKTNFGVNDYDSNSVTCPKCGNTACGEIVDSLQGPPTNIVPPLSADADKGDQDPTIHCGMAVRRLTPVECCRLMGWPDDWLDGYGFSDSTKYRMCGNGIVATVSEWLGKRIVTCLKQEDSLSHKVAR